MDKKIDKGLQGKIWPTGEKGKLGFSVTHIVVLTMKSADSIIFYEKWLLIKLFFI